MSQTSTVKAFNILTFGETFSFSIRWLFIRSFSFSQFLILVKKFIEFYDPFNPFGHVNSSLVKSYGISLSFTSSLETFKIESLRFWEIGRIISYVWMEPIRVINSYKIDVLTLFYDNYFRSKSLWKIPQYFSTLESQIGSPRLNEEFTISLNSE